MAITLLFFRPFYNNLKPGGVPAVSIIIIIIIIHQHDVRLFQTYLILMQFKFSLKVIDLTSQSINQPQLIGHIAVQALLCCDRLRELPPKRITGTDTNR